ncbi:prepilin-type N-terminal cleavage/methylation domain-containing protein [Luteolibacter marinus]|uniref:prepilin-type N-terminal cleavage/methylation domain-containing protein n=1 Tax=Luteolibacter marinus TaxID=2776705 RepID=UPI001D01A5C7
MTRAARTKSKAGASGFSLLEIVVVLILIAVLAGGAIGMMVMSDDDRALKRCSVEVEALAKRARTIASLQQRPYALEFYENRVSLMPLAEAQVDPQQREMAALMEENAGEEKPEGRFDSVRAGWELDSDMQIFIRRWASDNWIPADSKNREVWRFDPEGFCEPVGVRIVRGDSWLEAQFNPLTGSIRSTEKEVY